MIKISSSMKVSLQLNELEKDIDLVDYLTEKDKNRAGFSAENCWFSKESCQSAQLIWPVESDDDEFRI